ncbi:MAG: hypothetical protein WA888_24140 [Burkholderiaceae bacterium]
MIEKAPGPLSIRIVNDAKLRDEVFRLRYRAYTNEGEIPDNRSGMFADEYDDAPNQVSWALFMGNDLVGTVRSMFFSPAAEVLLPEHKVYGDIIPRVLPYNARVVSGNRFAIDPAYVSMGKRLTFQLLKHHIMVALVNGDWAIAAVKKHHQAFYERVMRLTPASEPRYYDEMNSSFTLMVANVLDKYASVCARHPSLRPNTSDLAFLKQIPDSFARVAARPIARETTAGATVGGATAGEKDAENTSEASTSGAGQTA